MHDVVDILEDSVDLFWDLFCSVGHVCVTDEADGFGSVFLQFWKCLRCLGSHCRHPLLFCLMFFRHNSLNGLVLGLLGRFLSKLTLFYGSRCS